jgi:hypothetical protein
MKRSFFIVVCFFVFSAVGIFGQHAAETCLTQNPSTSPTDGICINTHPQLPGRQAVLWDNGDTDGSNGYSNADVSVFGYQRTLLDDFVVPDGETWILTDFHSYQIWNSVAPGSGTDYQLTFRADDAGSPGAPIVTAVTVSYAEVETGRFWFGRPEYETQYVYEPITLTGGTYWVEGNVIGPDNNFWMVHAYPPGGSECWINYEDYGFMPASDLFGVQADLAYWLTGEKEEPPPPEDYFCQGELIYGATTSGPMGPSDLYRIDSISGTGDLVGPIVGFVHVSGMDFQPGTGRLFATCQRASDDTPVLITIDTNTGVGTEIGPTGMTHVVTDISFRSDGVLFAYDAEPAGHQVYTVNPSTGEATLVGSTGLAFAGGNGMGFDLGDTLYHSQNTWPPNNLNTIDQTNGSATLVGPLAMPAGPDPDSSRINAMDVHPSTGTMFASLNDNNSTGLWYLITVDPATLTASLVGTTVSGLNAIAWEPILWSNGDTDGSNGYSNMDAATAGIDRRLLDDFEVPDGEHWIITDFHSYQIWNSMPVGSGSDFVLDIYEDAAGSPGAWIATANTVSYNEVPTGRNWFGRDEYRTDYYFDLVDGAGFPVVLGPGIYWIEGHVVGPENNFWMVHAYPPGLSECWVNYEDFGFMPGSDIFGTPADLAYKLTHRKARFLEVVPEVLNSRWGGPFTLCLHAGAENADRVGVILGGVSGCLPGFNLPDGTHVPLNWDVITDLLLFTGLFIITTDENGEAYLNFVMPEKGPDIEICWVAVLKPPPSWWASNCAVLHLY